MTALSEPQPASFAQSIALRGDRRGGEIADVEANRLARDHRVDAVGRQVNIQVAEHTGYQGAHFIQQRMHLIVQRTAADGARSAAAGREWC